MKHKPYTGTLVKQRADRAARRARPRSRAEGAIQARTRIKPREASAGLSSTGQTVDTLLKH
jgi:hypothetical protein